MGISVTFTDDKLIAVIKIKLEKKQQVSKDKLLAYLSKERFACEWSQGQIEEEITLFNDSDDLVLKLPVLHDEYKKFQDRMNLLISPDEMHVYIRPKGPYQFNFEIQFKHIHRMMKMAKIVYGTIDENINKVVKGLNDRSFKEKTLIAEGKPEVMATDGSFLLLPDFTEELVINRVVRFGANKNTQKMQALKTAHPVLKGTVLLKQYPAVKGVEGVSVTGKKIWGENNRKAVKALVVNVSKNVMQQAKDGHAEYISQVNGIGYFINNQIIEVEEIFDGGFEIIISEDKMSAEAVLHPPKGGNPISQTKIFEEIGKKGIVHNLLATDLKKALEEANQDDGGKPRKVLIAQGTPPVNGLDGQIRWNIHLDLFYKPAIQQDGSVDYRGGNRYPFVRKGDLAGVWYMATKGRKKGSNVLGQPVDPQDGEDISLKLGNLFEFVDEEMDNRPIKTMTSKVSGLLRVKGNDISVEPVFEADKIDYSTGNIDFDGIVIVKEQISDGFHVKATGDIHINGNVGACTLESESDIHIKGGINGKNKCRIISRQNVFAKFVENASISARKGVYITNHSVLSELKGGEEVQVGIKRVKGRVLGGKLSAKKALRVDLVGSEKSTSEALLWAGVDKEVYDQHEQTKKSLEQLKIDITKTQKRINEEAEPGLKQGLEASLKQQLENMNQLQEDLEALKNAMFDESGVIEIREKAKAYTQLIIADKSYDLRVAAEKTCFKLAKDLIVKEPFAKKR
ncbi:MAG: DUF342 domain-containing protein [Spirochaetales bacterium]|nr:DUF342 domain-containing protein [Spirochaetales bacterium]